MVGFVCDNAACVDLRRSLAPDVEVKVEAPIVKEEPIEVTNKRVRRK